MNDALRPFSDERSPSVAICSPMNRIIRERIRSKLALDGLRCLERPSIRRREWRLVVIGCLSGPGVFAGRGSSHNPEWFFDTPLFGKVTVAADLRLVPIVRKLIL